MTIRRNTLAIASAALFFLAAIAGHARAEDSLDAIARYEANTQQMVSGHKAMVVAVTLLSNGRRVIAAIPNEDPKKYDPTPKKELADAVKAFAAGQIVKVSLMPAKDAIPTLVTIDRYESKPGEDTPNGYVFEKTFDNDKTHITTVVLSKYGVERSLNVPLHKGEKGQEPDADLIAALAKFQEGASVWVQAQGKNLVAIEPYADPQTGKVAKLGDTEVDGHKVKSADIETDGGKTVTVFVPGKVAGKNFIPDQMVMVQFGKVKVGSPVEFRVHGDGPDKLWLREITVVKPAPQKPADKDMAKKP